MVTVSVVDNRYGPASLSTASDRTQSTMNTDNKTNKQEATVPHGDQLATPSQVRDRKPRPGFVTWHCRQTDALFVAPMLTSNHDPSKKHGSTLGQATIRPQPAGERVDLRTVSQLVDMSHRRFRLTCNCDRHSMPRSRTRATPLRVCPLGPEISASKMQTFAPKKCNLGRTCNILSRKSHDT